jgi:NADH-quinone oxidoreductase subunit M
MPVFAGMTLIITMGSAGLPGLSGFVGEFLSLFGTFQAGSTFPDGWSSYIPMPRALAAIAGLGVILGAVYLLHMFQKVFFGPLDKTRNGKLPDLTGRELAVFIPLVIAIFAMGLAPRKILKTMEPSVNSFIRTYHRHLAEPDGPAHIYGTLPDPAAPAAPAPTAADVNKQLDDLAKQVDRTAKAIDVAAGGAP